MAHKLSFNGNNEIAFIRVIADFCEVRSTKFGVIYKKKTLLITFFFIFGEGFKKEVMLQIIYRLYRTYTPHLFIANIIMVLLFMFYAIKLITPKETLSNNNIAIISLEKNTTEKDKEHKYLQPNNIPNKIVTNHTDKLSQAIANLKNQLQQPSTKKETLVALLAPQYAIDSLIDSAKIYFELGKESEEKIDYKQALVYYEKAQSLKKDNSDYLNALGVINFKLGFYDKAIDHHQKALIIDKKNHGEEHLEIATGYNNLGIAWDLKGEYDKAIEYHEKALAINKKNHGEEHPDVAAGYNNLGTAFYSKGEDDKAIDYYLKALTMVKNYLGEEDQNVASGYNNLGLAWESKGEYDKALEYYEKALAIQEKTLGKDHPDTKLTAENIALAKSKLKP